MPAMNGSSAAPGSLARAFSIAARNRSCVRSSILFDGSTNDPWFVAVWLNCNDAIHNSGHLIVVVQPQVGRCESNQVRDILRIDLTCALEIVCGFSPATLTAVNQSS